MLVARTDKADVKKQNFDSFSLPHFANFLVENMKSVRPSETRHLL